MIKEKILPGVVLAFVGSFITFGFTWYQESYNQPRIILNTSRNYANFNGKQVGTVTVTNLGNRLDEDIVVNVYSKLDKGEIKTDGASVDNKVEIGADESKFIINKLNPGDTAVISFSSPDKETSFGLAANSRSNKVEETDVVPQWWEFSTTQKLFVTTTILFGFLVGFYFGKPIKNTRSRM